MRPTIYLTCAAAAFLAAAALTTPQQATAQDVYGRRGLETLVQTLGNGNVQIWRSDDSTRAVIGVSLAPARSRADTLGARVTLVDDDGPAAKAGIEEGDRIVSIDGTVLRVDPADADDPIFRDLATRRLLRALAKRKPGDEVSLVVQRGRESRTVRVKTVSAIQLADNRGVGLLTSRDRGFGGATVFGDRFFAVDSLRNRLAERPALGLTVGLTGSRRDTLGLFVSAVSTDGPAEKAGVVEGARIASIDGVDLRIDAADADDPEYAGARARRFTRELEKKRPGEDVVLRVWQNGTTRAVTVKAARAADVWKNGGGFAYSFGDGARSLVLPPNVSVPRLRMSAPGVWVTPNSLPSAPLRSTIVPRRTRST